VEDAGHVGRVEAVTVEELSYRAAAVVHEGLRAGDGDLDPAEAALGEAGVGGLDPEFDPGALRQPVRDREADVVSRVRVAVTGVAEADDELVDPRGAPAEESAHIPPKRGNRAASRNGPGPCGRLFR